MKRFAKFLEALKKGVRIERSVFKRGKSDTKTSSSFNVGGGYGDSIKWWKPEQFRQPITKDTRFDVVGWKTPMPKVGDSLKGEFRQSWRWFEFVEIEPCENPSDMFFAKVRPVREVRKA